ncbi:RusA family crossover junction endodeoxyribonuclease [Armatimonas sp.]|uniref:RusA family crossover junction endodeoxyribonuclease n=1 Tax=Armatimonas sp. TaxID=1872638 RepID=UPI00286B1D56|nr:RusA family crossover junction endodeoxyribonuclease [Armatimonas sp.]
MQPFEFVVVGRPISHQSNNKALLRQWQETVRTAAVTAWPEEQPPTTQPCLLVVVYFFGRLPAYLDNDNLLKPIQDALNGLVYEDDRQVTDTAIRRTSIEVQFRFRSGRHSALLMQTIRSETEFVYVRVEDAPSHEELL